ncbi:MAG: hypothetical protein ACT4PP_17350 [Sporichthyaceae bacterium]
MSRTLRITAAAAASTIALAGLPSVAAAVPSEKKPKGILKVCVVGHDGNKVRVTADEKKFAKYPRKDGCKDRNKRIGAYTLRTILDPASTVEFDRAVVQDPTGDSSGSDETQPVSVKVSAGQTTTVNIFLTAIDPDDD